MRDDRERLRDILDAIERIERYATRGRDVFDSNELIQTWVVHHLEMIGEAVRALSSDTTSEIRGVEWHKLVGMRNILIHAYFDIDLDLVWAVVEHHLPELKRVVMSTLEVSTSTE